MNWREWPQGAESIDAPGDRDICPVCSSTLRPVEVYYTSTYDNTTYYTAICPRCRTKYNRCAKNVTISPDTETIIALEERVHTLEETLSRLITWIRTQQQPQQLRTTQKQKTSQDDTEEFTHKYRYLL